MDGPGRSAIERGPEWAALLARLHARARLGMLLGTERVDRVLAALDRPERAFPAIHVAGTNGKGSTASFLASILGASGRRVGLYTSPHLSSLTERVQIVEGGEYREIEPAQLLSAFARVEPLAAELTFFEVVTVAALVALRELGVELAVIEAGIGARNDATRVVDAEVSVLTEIALEHTDILGPTLADIARDKAAVMRPGRPLVAADAPEEAMAEVDALARELRCKVYRIGRELAVEGEGLRLGPERRVEGARLALAGRHQYRNALLAAKAATLWDPTLGDEQIRAGLLGARWPGRLERVGDVLLDGAHNPQGVGALVAALERGRPQHLVFAVLGDKDAAPMIAELAEVAASLTLTRPSDTPRARAPEELRALLPVALAIPCEAIAEPARALEAARARAARDGGQVVVAGSLYLVGELRAQLTSR